MASLISNSIVCVANTLSLTRRASSRSTVGQSANNKFQETETNAATSPGDTYLLLRLEGQNARGARLRYFSASLVLL